jgi:NitT/TauT family transport system permease protein
MEPLPVIIDTARETLARTAPDNALARVRSCLRPLSKLSKFSLSIVVFLLLWETLPRLGIVNSLFLPPVSVVFESIVTMTATGEIFTDISISMQRALIGFGLAVLLAVPLGFAMGWSKSIEEYTDGLLQLLRQSSSLSLFPVFILFLGIGETSKIAIIAWACFWPILLSTISGVKDIEPLLIKMARTLNMGSGFNLFFKVVLPATIPSIMTGIRLSASVAIIVLVAAEMIGSSSGLGYMIMSAEYNFALPKMYAGILILAVLGFLINYVLVWLEARAMTWKEQVTKN